MKLSLQEKIEEISLLSFSRQGFNETSTSEIAKSARVSETSIFRIFKTKQDLYIHVLEKYGSKANLDYNLIFSNITFDDINLDLKVIVDYYFKFYFDNIHITRIYISNAIQFQELLGFNYLIFPQLRDFMEKYFKEMSTRGFIHEKASIQLTDLITSSILQDVALLTTFEKLEQLDNETKTKLDQKWNKTIIELGKIYGWNKPGDALYE